MPWQRNINNQPVAIPGPMPFDPVAAVAEAVANLNAPAFVMDANIPGQPGQLTRYVYVYVHVTDGQGNVWTVCVVLHLHFIPGQGWIAGNTFIPGWANWQIQTPPAAVPAIAALPLQGQFPGNDRYPRQGAHLALQPAADGVSDGQLAMPVEQIVEILLLDLAESVASGGGSPGQTVPQLRANQLAAAAAGTTPPPLPSAITPATPNPGNGKTNVAATKHYAVNETGNIMVVSTAGKDGSISQAAQDLFQEVAVFFAAMTKAIAETPRPGLTAPYKPGDYYTLYDFEAIESIVNNSGMFVNVNREDLLIEHSGTTADFNTDLIATLLGFAMTDGAAFVALQGALRALGSHAVLSANQDKSSGRIGHLMFVCEYLMGVPLVSAQYFSLDETSTSTIVQVGPCLKVTNQSFHITIHKDTFMFVVPAWIRKYSSDLASVAGTQDYQLLVRELQSYITGSPVIVGVYDSASGGKTPLDTTQLSDGKTYSIAYINAADKLADALKLNASDPASLYIGGVKQTVSGASSWANDSVSFTASKGTGTQTAGPIVVQLNDKAKTQFSSTVIYSVS